MPIYIIYLCDDWKSYSSMTFIGATRNKRKLMRKIKQMLVENEIENESGGYSIEELFDAFSINQIDGMLKYVHIKEVFDADWES